MIKVTRTAIDGVLIFEPKLFGDARGFFLESFNEEAFKEAVGDEVRFVQDNQWRSAKRVMRGLHYQLPPMPRASWSASGGEVCSTSRLTCAAEVRSSGNGWVELTDENNRQVWIPAEIAHGFLVIGDTADFLCETTACYAPEAERSVRWNDPDLATRGQRIVRLPCSLRRTAEPLG